MKAWSAIFNLIAVMMLIFMLVIYLNYTKVIRRDFDQARFNQAVEYATEGMFQKTIEVEDIDTDYSDMYAVEINPSDSLDIFESIMCFNYNMSPSEENKKHIENFMPTAVLSTNDGYYIAQWIEDHGLHWSLKYPYYIDIGDKSYTVNLHREKWMSGTEAGNFKVSVGSGYESGITMEEVLTAANNQINLAMISEIERKNDNGNTFNFKFFLPSETTERGVNPIQGPSVLLFMQGVDFASTERMNSIAVSGYKTVNRANVVAFIENGRKFYCYESQMDPNLISLGVYDIVDTYRTIEDAALDGYSPHFDLLTKKITKYYG